MGRVIKRRPIDQGVSQLPSGALFCFFGEEFPLKLDQPKNGCPFFSLATGHLRCDNGCNKLLVGDRPQCHFWSKGLLLRSSAHLAEVVFRRHMLLTQPSILGGGRFGDAAIWC